MIGIPGSGKSTVAAQLAGDGKIFSSDAQRKKLFGDENCQNNPKLVFDTLYKQIEDYMDNEQKTVVFDATNISRKTRHQIIDICKKHGYEAKAIVVKVSKETCIKRDRQRTRTVGEAVINRMYNSFEYPKLDEGFSEIRDIENE